MTPVHSAVPLFRGIYINLDRSGARRARVELQLRQRGLASDYARLAASDGAVSVASPSALAAGAIGCFHSHMRALELAAEADGITHIMEDDVVPSDRVPRFARMLLQAGVMNAHDIIFLEMWIQPKQALVEALQAAFARASAPGGPLDLAAVQLLDMRQLPIASAASYLVTRSGAARLLARLRGEIQAGPLLPVDDFMDRLVKAGEVRAALAVPFLTATDVEDGARSRIQPKLTEDYTRLMLLLRNSLSADRDPQAIRSALATLLARNPQDATFRHVADAIERGLAPTASAPRGVYINLDRSPERRRRVEGELAGLGVLPSYQRLAAVDGSALPPRRLGPGAVGCFLSHIAALERAASAVGPFHVIEDDTIPSRYVQPFMDLIARHGVLDRIDIVFTEMWIDADDLVVRPLQQLLAEALPPGVAFSAERTRLLDMHKLRVGSTASYIVGPRGAAKILSLLRPEAASGPRLPLDAFLHRQVQEGRIAAALTIPFLTATDIADGSASMIQTIEADYTRLLLLLRNSFFADRDREAMRAVLTTLRHRRASDPNFDYVAKAVGVDPASML